MNTETPPAITPAPPPTVETNDNQVNPITNELEKAIVSKEKLVVKKSKKEKPVFENEEVYTTRSFLTNLF